METVTTDQARHYQDSGEYRLSWFALSNAARQDWSCEAPRHGDRHPPAQWLMIIVLIPVTPDDAPQVRQACYQCQSCRGAMERDIAKVHAGAG